jgi:hypothetical protein
MLDPFASSTIFWLAVGVTGVLIALRGTPLAETVSVLVRLLGIALPVGLVFAVPISFALNATSLPDPLRPGLLAALVVVAGWIVTFLFQELGRSQDQTDLMLALRAEIFVIREQIDPDQTRSYLDRLRQEFAAARNSATDFRPFVTMPPDATVFDGVVGQVTRLPSETVDEVIQFYSLLSDVKVFATDLRSNEFQALATDRREMALCDYVETRIRLAEIADEALDSLNKAIGLERRNGLFRSRRRSPVAGRPDPKSDAVVSENRP